MKVFAIRALPYKSLLRNISMFQIDWVFPLPTDDPEKCFIVVMFFTRQAAETCKEFILEKTKDDPTPRELEILELEISGIEEVTQEHVQPFIDAQNERIEKMALEAMNKGDMPQA